MFYTLDCVCVLPFGFFPFIKAFFRVFTRNARKTSHRSCFLREINGFEEEKRRRQRRTHQLESEGPGSFLSSLCLFLPLFSFLSALLLLLLLLLGLFFRKRARFSFLKNRFPPISPSLLLKRNTNLSSLLKNRTTPRCTLK